MTTTNFDWIAPVYDALAFVVFGNRLQQAQTVFLNRIPVGASILIVGGGTGLLLEQVLQRCRPQHVLYLETSARMVALASRRILRKQVPGSVEFRVGDETTLLPTEQFDVILTPFLLDLIPEPVFRSQLIPCIRRGLKPGSLWLVTDFINTDKGWQKALLWSMIRFFRLTAGIKTRRLADWQRILTESGFVRLHHELRVGGMVATEGWRQGILT
ncbi:class I SAM-dependent methyltransferase [Spirosoma koreense]